MCIDKLYAYVLCIFVYLFIFLGILIFLCTVVCWNFSCFSGGLVNCLFQFACAMQGFFV